MPLAVDEVEFREFFADQYARLCEDLPEAEVARLLGLPLGTVTSLAHRGLARLRDRLGSTDLDPTMPTRREGR